MLFVARLSQPRADLRIVARLSQPRAVHRSFGTNEPQSYSTLGSTTGTQMRRRVEFPVPLFRRFPFHIHPGTSSVNTLLRTVAFAFVVCPFGLVAQAHPGHGRSGPGHFLTEPEHLLALLAFVLVIVVLGRVTLGSIVAKRVKRRV
jgi:hypothetical protein